MREPRIKIPPAEGEAVYHCMTRTVNGEWLLDDVAKEILRRQLWQVADYCGVQIPTYTILSNHFHVLVRVPRAEPVTDTELLRRYSVLYPRPTRHQTARLDVIQRELTCDGPRAMAWRKSQLALMGDVSQFMKLLKQRFSIWFNRSHQRFGTLWAERFKSELIEPAKNALQTIAAYIDLNCVRAGLVADPKDYRFCGYAEAVAGNELARNGLRHLLGTSDWSNTQAAYREQLFAAGSAEREGKAAITHSELARVIANRGQLPKTAVLRCRLRYFTDGAVLGSAAFVQTQLLRYRQQTGRRRSQAPCPMPACTDWGDLATLRRVRLPAMR